jgi:hypothetical protein
MWCLMRRERERRLCDVLREFADADVIPAEGSQCTDMCDICTQYTAVSLKERK